MGLRLFVRNVSYVLLLLLLILIGAKWAGWISRELFVTLVVCKLLATLHFLAGVYLNDFALKKGQQLFMILTLGGMGARLFLTVPVLLITQNLLKISFLSFILLFFIFYIFFLILEIFYLLKLEQQRTKIR